MAAAALYRPIGTSRRDDGLETETFAVTDHVTSPWGPAMQHGGAVAALLTRSMERCQPRTGTRIGRVTVDLLGPVPMDEIRVAAWIERPGRRIELIRSTLDARDPSGSWRACALGSAWRLATQPTADAVHRADATVPLPAPGGATLHDYDMPEAWRVGGFVSTLQWRVAVLGSREGEPTIAWVNLTHPLIDGEAPTDLQRVVAAADTANGIGARLDPARFVFLNNEMTVHLHRPPTGHWYGLQAETSVGPDGIGMSAAVIHAEDGPIGRVTQSVLIERRTREVS